MRQMSFQLTTEQILARTKTVTRRLGWHAVKPCDWIQAVEKGMGIGKGGKVRKLAVLRVAAVEREPLLRLLADRDYGRREVKAEGFTGLNFMTVEQFVEFFCNSHKGCEPGSTVTRIAFEYVDRPAHPFWCDHCGQKAPFTIRGCEIPHLDGCSRRGEDPELAYARAAEWVRQTREPIP